MHYAPMPPHTRILILFTVLGASLASAQPAPAALKPVDLFVGGTEGYHTYRIPALAVTTKGTLLAFCEARKTSAADHGDIDLVLKRSTDGGATWSRLQVVHEEGGEAPITIGNPCVIATPEGVVHLLLCRNNQRAFALKSIDDGATFSPPREITESFKAFPFPWARLATGPGHGIRTSRGRLVAPIWLNDRVGGEYRSGALFSDDGGATWKAGGLLPALNAKQNECTVAEVAPGELLLNARSEVPKRSVARSRDEGLTWTDARQDESTVTVCQGSLLALPERGGMKGGLLFSLPAGPGRKGLTVRRSRDGGATWADLPPLHAGPSGYSDLATLPNGRVACLYERGEKQYRERITFATLNPE